MTPIATKVLCSASIGTTSGLREKVYNLNTSSKSKALELFPILRHSACTQDRSDTYSKGHIGKVGPLHKVINLRESRYVLCRTWFELIFPVREIGFAYNNKSRYRSFSSNRLLLNAEMYSIIFMRFMLAAVNGGMCDTLVPGVINILKDCQCRRCVV